MKKILYWSKESSEPNKREALLKKDVETKFIVLTGQFKVEWHFPKSLYEYEILEDK